MGFDSSIQWTGHSHNFWEGCFKKNKDCLNCYADRLFGRFGKDFRNIRRIKNFDAPLRWKEPSKIFTCSMSDFFIEQADEWRDEAWAVIKACPQHTFQILTKRPERILANLPADWGEGYDNVWLGTSVGHPQYAHMLLDLLKVPAKVHFASIEPLWGNVDLTQVIGRDGFTYDVLIRNFYESTLLHELKWVVVGGESGNDIGKYKYRPCKLEWIEDVVNLCKWHNVPVFVKQMGTHLAKELGIQKGDRHGGNFDNFPESVKYREFPL